MTRIDLVLLAALMQSSVAFSADSSIDFYFANDASWNRPALRAIQEWTERCVAGGEFAEFAASYAPDLKMSVDERKAQATKFDRAEAVRIATDAWRKANAALPQGSLRVCIDLTHPADDFTRSRYGWNFRGYCWTRTHHLARSSGRRLEVSPALCSRP